jgi:Tfp pilus assembly protein PilP
MKNGKAQLEPSQTKGLSNVLVTGMLILSLTIGSGCGFIQGFFGDDDKGAGNKVKGTVAAKVKPQAKPAPKPQASKEEDEELTLEKLKEMQKAQEDKFQLNAQLMHDPFAPLAVVDETPPPPPKELPPLQKLELSQIKLVAVVIADGKTRALVEDSTGMGYIIQEGTEIGPPDKKGRVTSITRDEKEGLLVLIKQEKKDYMGKTKEIDYKMKLHPIEGEKK